MLVSRAGHLLRLHNGWSPDDSWISTHTQGTLFEWAVTDLVNSNRLRHFHAKCFDSHLQTERAQWAVVTRILGSSVYGCGFVYPWPSTQGTAENGLSWKHSLFFQGKLSKLLHAGCQLQAHCPCLHLLCSPRETGAPQPRPAWPLSCSQQRRDRYWQRSVRDLEPDGSGHKSPLLHLLVVWSYASHLHFLTLSFTRWKLEITEPTQ